jgi:phosphohistidine phosphatase
VSDVRVYLVHHADAVEPQVDAQRPLSAAGRQRADRLAAEAADRGVAPRTIWHSGKLRARQTAEIFLLRCSPFASFRMVRGLGPGDPVDWIADAIEAEDIDLLVVGHMPQLSELANRLSRSASQFPAHGLIGLERVGARMYEQRLVLSQEPGGS